MIAGVCVHRLRELVSQKNVARFPRQVSVWAAASFCSCCPHRKQCAAATCIPTMEALQPLSPPPPHPTPPSHPPHPHLPVIADTRTTRWVIFSSSSRFHHISMRCGGGESLNAALQLQQPPPLPPPPSPHPHPWLEDAGICRLPIAVAAVRHGTKAEYGQTV